MSELTLPKTIDPLKYADQNKILKGSLSIKLMPRLAELLADADGEVNVKLDFDRDAQNYRVLNGELDAKVSLLPSTKPTRMVCARQESANLRDLG